MPIPILLMLAGGGVAATAGYFVNEDAKKKEQKVESLQNETVKQMEELSAEWQAEKSSFVAKMKGCQASVKSVYNNYQSRSTVIFDRFGHPTADFSEWTLPPGMKEMEAINIPPIEEILDIDGETKFKAELGKFIGRDMRIVSMIHRGHPVQQGGDFALRAGFSVLNAATKRQEVAEKNLTQATEFSTRAKKFKEEVAGRKTTNSYLCKRAEQSSANIKYYGNFAETYTAICEEYIRAGKTRQTLSDEEYINVKYLARVMASLTQHANQPLA